MQHPEYVARVREMTPAERLEIALELADIGWRYFATLPPEEEQRRLKIAHGGPWRVPTEKTGDS
jgi:hypothetical protein